MILEQAGASKALVANSNRQQVHAGAGLVKIFFCRSSGTGMIAQEMHRWPAACTGLQRVSLNVPICAI